MCCAESRIERGQGHQNLHNMGVRPPVDNRAYAMTTPPVERRTPYTGLSAGVDDVERCFVLRRGVVSGAVVDCPRLGCRGPAEKLPRRRRVSPGREKSVGCQARQAWTRDTSGRRRCLSPETLVFLALICNPSPLASHRRGSAPGRGVRPCSTQPTMIATKKKKMQVE